MGSVLTLFLLNLEVCITIMTSVIVEHQSLLNCFSEHAHYFFQIIFQIIIPNCVCVFVQGKETTEEEDEVAVGMEKGFMDEFFEQVCFSHSPDLPFFSLCHSHSHL